MFHDHADRDAISSRLLRYRDERGGDWADIIVILATAFALAFTFSSAFRSAVLPGS